jgi:hypothetical protein
MADLVTRIEYKNYAGITSSNSDAEIDLLIPKISKLVKSYCKRSFIDYYDQTYVQYSDGGFDRILLEEIPVTDVLNVRYSSNYGQSYSTTLVEFTDWIQDGDSVRSISNSIFLPAIKGYQIQYLAGFDATPDDLKLAVFDLIEYYMKNNSAVHVNRDVTPNITQIQYINSTGFPPHIRRILDSYVADYS